MFLKFSRVHWSSCGQVALYTAGFPCKAFSKLRVHTDWLDDVEARQFYAVRNTIQSTQPLVPLLLQTEFMYSKFVVRNRNLSVVSSLSPLEGRGFGECHRHHECD